ncbi:MAG: response regulator [Limisphaerales bacterium]
MKRILITDDHDVVRAGLHRIISDQLANVEFGEAADAEELLKMAKESVWDLIISDIKMPGRSGIDILKELRETAPDTPVIILTAFPESDYGARALEEGAAGFINKARVSTELPNAIRKVLTGNKYVSPQLAEALANYIGGKPNKDAHSLLSEREMQVTKLIAVGRETGEIASDLALSEKTIATYRARIYEKLTVKNNVELTRYALKHKLVDP